MNKGNEILSTTEKCRKTKLSKKSVEELISIILRKDDTERKLSNQVNNYKKLQSLNEKRFATLKETIANYEKLVADQDTAINKDADNINRLHDIIDYKDKTIVENNSRITYLNDEIIKRNRTIRNLLLICIGFSIVIVLQMFI